MSFANKQLNHYTSGSVTPPTINKLAVIPRHSPRRSTKPRRQLLRETAGFHQKTRKCARNEESMREQKTPFSGDNP